MFTQAEPDMRAQCEGNDKLPPPLRKKGLAPRYDGHLRDSQSRSFALVSLIISVVFFRPGLFLSMGGGRGETEGQRTVQRTRRCLIWFVKALCLLFQHEENMKLALPRKNKKRELEAVWLFAEPARGLKIWLAGMWSAARAFRAAQYRGSTVLFRRRTVRRFWSQ